MNEPEPSRGSPPLRAAILEDHPLVREALVEALTQAGMQVTTSTGQAREFLTEVSAAPPELAVVDLRLDPGSDGSAEDGHQVLRALRDSLPAVRPVVLSGSLDKEQVERCFQEGAWGYLYKLTADAPAVVRALREVVGGGRVYPLDSFTTLRSGPPPAPRPGQHLLARLTARERQVLACIAAGHDNLKIGALLAIGERTVKTHVAAIYRKLAVEGRVQAALLARELGVEPLN